MSEYSLDERTLARFWVKVNKQGPIHPKLKSRCWLWLGGQSGHGYGRIMLNRKTYITHRLAYEVSIGPIPSGLVLDHLCRNKACCNPEHLEAVTSRENTLRGFGPTAVLAKKQFCKYGHPLSGKNLYLPPHHPGRRECRICKKTLRKKAEAKKARAKKLGFVAGAGVGVSSRISLNVSTVLKAAKNPLTVREIAALAECSESSVRRYIDHSRLVNHSGFDQPSELYPKLTWARVEKLVTTAYVLEAAAGTGEK